VGRVQAGQRAVRFDTAGKARRVRVKRGLERQAGLGGARWS